MSSNIAYSGVRFDTDIPSLMGRGACKIFNSNGNEIFPVTPEIFKWRGNKDSVPVVDWGPKCIGSGGITSAKPAVTVYLGAMLAADAIVRDFLGAEKTDEIPVYIIAMFRRRFLDRANFSSFEIEEKEIYDFLKDCLGYD